MSENIGAVKSEKDATTESTVEKNTNRVFDQSEHDRLVSEALRAEREKYKDYHAKTKRLEELERLQEEASLKEKSELERKDHEITKLTNSLKEYESSMKQYQLKDLRSKVLSDIKYKDLPAVYRNAIQLSDSEIELQAEADKILEQWKQDFNITGKSFGIPDEKRPADKKSVVSDPDSFRDRLKERMLGRKR